MADFNHKNRKRLILKLTDEAIIANPESVEPSHLCRKSLAQEPRIRRREKPFVHEFEDSPLRSCVQVRELLLRFGEKTDLPGQEIS